MDTLTADAVVVGAGTAGANAAAQLAQRGCSVVLIERRSLGEAGARWHNGVLDWQFDAAGVERPAGAERCAEGRPHHVLAPDGTHAATLTSAVVRADMTMLGDRLRALAGARGVRMLGGVQRIEPDYEGDRLVRLRCWVPGSDRVVDTTLNATLFVDASGRRGVLRRSSPILSRWCPQVGGNELCSATDVELDVDDPDRALEFLARHGAEPGDTVSWLGRDGGFSTINVTVAPGLDEVSVLVGCLANGRYSTGPAMLARLRREEPWIGEVRMGGSGIIPLRRPYSRLSAPGLALVGDAGAQVFPAHGSGIGMGLIAGTMLADVVADAGDPGSADTLWGYQARFHRRHGGDLLAYDVFRRTSTALGTAGVTTMLRSGLLHPVLAAAGLDQRWTRPPPEVTVEMARRMVRVPGFAARLVPRLARSELAARIGGRYPETPDDAALERHEATVQRVLGPLPA